MRSVRVPFRQAVAPAEPATWFLVRADSTDELPTELPDWDPCVDLKVRRALALDGVRLRDQCALADGASIRLIAGYQAESARTRAYPWSHDLAVPNRFEGLVEFLVPGAAVTASVTLVVGAVLVDPGRGQGRIGARLAGSWLWKESTEVRLEQSRGRFPMEWTDFAGSGLVPEAGWYLDWPAQNWDAPLLGSLRLRLNATNPAMKRILELAPTDARRRIALQGALLDVAKQLAVAALCSEEFLENHATYAEGSVGYSARQLLAIAFPGDSPKRLWELLRDRSGDFHVQFQARVVPFEEEVS